jgi:threonine dehydrogenase-like Zn-dependent dehydrogenase
MPHAEPVIAFDWGAMYYRLPNMIVVNSARSGEVTPAVKTAIDLMSQGKLNPAYMVSHKLPFEEVGKAYELFSRRQDGAVKVLISV